MAWSSVQISISSESHPVLFKHKNTINNNQYIQKVFINNKELNDINHFFFDNETLSIKTLLVKNDGPPEIIKKKLTVKINNIPQNISWQTIEKNLFQSEKALVPLQAGQYLFEIGMNGIYKEFLLQIIDDDKDPPQLIEEYQYFNQQRRNVTYKIKLFDQSGINTKETFLQSIFISKDSEKTALPLSANWYNFFSSQKIVTLSGTLDKKSIKEDHEILLNIFAADNDQDHQNDSHSTTLSYRLVPLKEGYFNKSLKLSLVVNDDQKSRLFFEQNIHQIEEQMQIQLMSRDISHQTQRINLDIISLKTNSFFKRIYLILELKEKNTVYLNDRLFLLITINALLFKNQYDLMITPSSVKNPNPQIPYNAKSIKLF